MGDLHEINRTEKIIFRVTPAERVLIEAAADKQQLPPSTYCREINVAASEQVLGVSLGKFVKERTRARSKPPPAPSLT